MLQRGELVAGLIELAHAYKHTEVLFDVAVASVNPPTDAHSKPSVTLKGGTTLYADIVIGADGIRSITRPVVTGVKDRPTDTGDVAFRCVDSMLQL